MNLFGKRNAGSSSNDNPIFLLIAAVLFPFIEGAKWCTDKVYSGFAGAFRALFGLAFAFGGAAYVGNYVGWELGHAWYAWFPAAAAAWVAVFWYLWPLLYRFVVGPTIKLVDAIYDGIRQFTKEYTKPITDGIVKVISTVCVGSGGAWAKVQSKEHEDTWFAKLIGAVSHLSAFGGSAYLGWSAYEWVGAAVTFPVVGFALSIAAGILTFGVLFGLVEQLMKYGKFSFIGIALGVPAVWGAASYLTAWTGVSGLATYAVYAAAYVAFVGYVFPLVNVFFTLGLLEKLWKIVKPLPEKTYDDRKNSYSEFFHHLVNIATTGGIGYGTWAIATGSLALPLVAAVAITALVVAVSYIMVYKLIGHEGGNFVIGGLVSIAAAVYTGIAYVDAGFIYGVYGAIVAGVLALLVTGFLAFPLVYLTMKGVLNFLGASHLAAPLTALYNGVNEAFKKAVKQLRHAWTYCYDDKSDYKPLVIHVTNIAVAVGVFYGAGMLCTLMGAGTILGWFLTVLATGLSYLLVGKLMFKTGYRLEFLSAVLSLAAGIFVGTEVYATNPTDLYKVVAVIAGGAAWSGVFLIVFPVAYVVLKTLTSWALTGWLKPLLQAVYDWNWSWFAGFWSQFAGAYRLLKKVFAPIFARVAAAFAKVSAAYNRILDRIRGR